MVLAANLVLDFDGLATTLPFHRDLTSNLYLPSTYARVGDAGAPGMETVQAGSAIRTPAGSKAKGKSVNRQNEED